MRRGQRGRAAAAAMKGEGERYDPIKLAMEYAARGCSRFYGRL